MPTTEVCEVHSADATRLTESARSFVPRLREKARAMELARRLDDELVAEMDAAGLFSLLVPERWGGPALGLRELNTVTEVLAHGDVSMAWVASFYNIHNWMLCRFPLAVQEQLYAGRSSVLAAAVLSTPGTAEVVDGGYCISGRWGYATGILHSTHALVPVISDGVLCWCIVERAQLDVGDNWDMAAMAATGSVTISTERAFVPADRMCPVERVTSPTDHPGIVHEDLAYRLPFSALGLSTASIYVGAVDAGVELARENLARASGPDPVPRIERAPQRINWVNAFQTARVLRLVRDAATDDVLRIAASGRARTPDDEARTQLDVTTLIQTAKATLRTLVDASGSSGYRSTDLLRRLANDIAMISTHALNGEYDVTMDRHARRLLGARRPNGAPGAKAG